ncbi:unnamed protein product [Gongylonema pulchrum]|uniref:Cyclin N-terminal domain-containing protein n=1 Tax=Gongylonema pulchrum TaxID=637853 RepID=A0A183CZW8_9BILA|nr:unnamed protein product [Gongylonema pulchrum]
MLKRQERNKENAPPKAGKQKAGEARQGRIRGPAASDLFGKSKKIDLNTAMRDPARKTLSNVGNTTREEKEASKDEMDLKIPPCAGNTNHTLTETSRQSRSISQEKQRNHMTVGKELAVFIPRVTASGMQLRPMRASAENTTADNFAAHKEKAKIQKPSSNETADNARARDAQTVRVETQMIAAEQQLMPKGQPVTKKHPNNSNCGDACDEYAEDIWQFLEYLESRYELPQNFFSGSKVTPKMRMITLEWFAFFATTFQLLPETFLRTVHLFDRYIVAHLLEIDKVSIKRIRSSMLPMRIVTRDC